MNDVTIYLWLLWYFTAAIYALASVFSSNVLYKYKHITLEDRLRVGVVTGAHLEWLPGSWCLLQQVFSMTAISKLVYIKTASRI